MRATVRDLATRLREPAAPSAFFRYEIPAMTLQSTAA
jgi:hypothetical protein